MKFELAEQINRLSKEIHAGNIKRGFHEKEQPTTHYLMLAVTELSEAIEAERDGNRVCSPDAARNFALAVKWGDFQPSEFSLEIKDTMPDKIADCIIRLLDFCALRKVPIGFHIAAKLAYSETGPYKHDKAH